VSGGFRLARRCAAGYGRAMADKPLSPAQFISALLTAVRELTGRRPPPTWTHVDKVQLKLETDNRDAIDAAIRVAVARNWLRADGDPPQSITLTVDGVKMLEPAGPTNPS
jgi:hypothetical protein